MPKVKKFGTFSGVFTPSILTILGVIMYLRFPAIIGQAGLINTIGIICIAHIISVTTSLSVASLSTDKPVKNGGTYFMISRSLGLPIGGTLGISLFVGLAFSVSLYLIGFAESFLQYWEFENNIQSIRITGSIILVVVTTITFISTSLAIKSQYFIMAAIVLSLISIFLGFGHHDFAPKEINFAPLATSAPFMLLFGIFFPAVTGFEAGVSMSGDLKDPKKSLPYGAMLAVGVGFIVYIILAFFYTYTVDSEALVNDPQILFKISLSPVLVIVGIWGATLSSALGSILGAPRIFQAIAQDKIVPKFFAKGTGKTNEPRNALLLAFVIAEIGILIGELDVIARIVSMFFITTYAFLNLAAAIESWSSSDYRPAFKVPKFVSILGSLAAFFVMILLDFVALAGATIVLGLLYFYLRRRELILESGDAWSSFWTNLAKKSLLKLSKKKGNSRHWRPNIILFSGQAQSRPHLVEMGLSLTGKLGALTDFNLIDDPNISSDINTKVEPVELSEKQHYFSRDFHCESVQSGIKTVTSVYGFTGFEPNTVLMGWSRQIQNAEFLADVIRDLKSKQLNACFLDYDKNNGFGKKEHIDIWWNGKGRFLSFALNILKFLLSDSEWRDARARILIINGQTAIEDSLIRNTKDILLEARIQADVKIINNDFGSRTREEIIQAESSQADLLMLGISQNKNDYTVEYINYINRISSLSASLLLLSPSREFEEISLFENLQTINTEEIFEVNTEDLPALPESENKVISKNIERLDADCMNIGSIFIEKSIDKTIGSIKQFQLAFREYIEKNSSNLETEIASGEKAMLLKTISKNHQLFLRKTAQLLEQKNSSVFTELSANLKHGISNFKSRIGNYIYELPEVVFIPFVHTDGKEKEIKFPYRKNTEYHINAFLKPEIKQLLDAMERVIIRQIIRLRDILFSINDSYEKLELSKGDNFKSILDEMGEHIRSLNDLEEEISNLRKSTNSLILETFRKLSIEIANDMIAALSIGKPLKRKHAKPENLDEYFASYADYFGSGIMLLNNSMYLDAFILSSKNTAKNIVKSGNKKIAARVDEVFLSPLEKLMTTTQKIIENPSHEFKPIHFPEQIQIQDIFNEVWNKLVEIKYSYPEELELPVSLYHSEGNLTFSDYSPINTNLNKTANYYIDTLFYEPFYRQIQQIESTLMNLMVKSNEGQSLLTFHLNNQKNQLPEEGSDPEITTQVYTKLLNQLSSEKETVKAELNQLDDLSGIRLQDAFSNLFYHSIADAADKIRGEQLELQGKRFANIISKGFLRIKNSFNNFIVYLINSSSSGVLISRKYLASKERSYAQMSEILQLVDHLIPNQNTNNAVPAFYRNLMNSSSKINEEFWVPRKVEFDQIKEAIQRHKRGIGGALLVKGAHGSGKTAIARYTTAHFCKKKNVIWVEAPMGGSTDVQDFLLEIQQKLFIHEDFPGLFNAMSFDTTIVINNLELWWERRPGGMNVLQKIIDLIQLYGHKVLFIVNCNVHAFNIIKKLVPLEENCLSIVECEPFNARELQDLILTRHKSSGIHFEYKGIPEESISQLTLSLLFNSYFNVTNGIPGVALNSWKANITDAKEETIYIKKPELPNHSVLMNLPPDWLVILSLFIQHKHMNEIKLMRLSHLSEDQVKTMLLNLKNAGILVYKTPDILVIGRNVEPLIVDTCVAKGLI
jgi:amino acid transporter